VVAWLLARRVMAKEFSSDSKQEPFQRQARLIGLLHHRR
jgi:hypothetical protein